MATPPRPTRDPQAGKRGVGLWASRPSSPSWAPVLTGPPAVASPGQEYSGPFFGADNFPPGCIRDWDANNPENTCFHIKTDINGLDSPQIDVVIMVPASATAERDMRIARQAIEMWEGGIDYLAPQMGLGWLADGTDFHVTVDYFDPLGGNGGEFTTYPIVDPEIVVIAANPFPLGITQDPPHTVAREGARWEGSARSLTGSPQVLLDQYGHVLPDGAEATAQSVVPDEEPLDVPVVFTNQDHVPCHTVQNPFDFSYWQSLPGFDSHDEERSGTYKEDCDGAGGNICFAIAGATDPAPHALDSLKVLFEVVAHEVGHCLSVGHVGDGGEGHAGTVWGPAPYSDLMSYSDYPARRYTCVSTLNVEAIAIRMSRYLDVNGDGLVDASDHLAANDQIGIQGTPVQVQHPRDHLYASGTGSALDCPQPDVGLLPGPRTDWTPDPVDTVDHTLGLTGPTDGSVSNDGAFEVSGTLDRHSLNNDPPQSPVAATDDAGGDSSSAYTDIVGLGVELTATDFIATLRMADMWTTTPRSPMQYGIDINGWRQTTYEFETGAAFATRGQAHWDEANKKIELVIPRSQLSSVGIRAPFAVSAVASVRRAGVDDDHAPELGRVLAVGDPVAGCGDPCPDADGDGVADRDDDCPDLSGNGADGCVIVATEHVHVYVDGAHAASQDVDTSRGPDSFDISVEVPEGAHTLRVDWEDEGEVVATKSVSVRTSTDDDGDGVPNPEDACPGFDDRADVDGDSLPDACDPDLDGDGVANGADNCSGKANADQADMDGDRRGDVCDPDMDGDGYSNGHEVAFGTDPADPKSHPVVPRADSPVGHSQPGIAATSGNGS